MRIVQINALDKGSTGKIMLGIADVARKQGHDVYTFSSSRKAEYPSVINHTYMDGKLSYYIHMFGGMYTGFEMAFSYFATKKLIKHIRKINPDIIHLHIMHGFYLNHKLFFNYLQKCNAKIIWTLHDCWSFTGRCPHFQITKCNKWKDGCGNCEYDPKAYPQSYVFDRTAIQWRSKKALYSGLKSLVLVTPSNWLGALLSDSYLREYPVEVINNGIDLSVFRPFKNRIREKYGISDDAKIILGVAFNWGERKGLDVFVKLAESLPKDYRIVLVGTNDKVDGQIPSKIVSIHRTSNQQELAELYSEAEVFVNPTREEVLGLVNIEALACGTPVVTFKTGGSPECIDDTCGIVVPCNDVEAMEKAIRKICEEKLFPKEACVARAELFDQNEKYREYVKLYERCYQE